MKHSHNQKHKLKDNNTTFNIENINFKGGKRIEITIDVSFNQSEKYYSKASIARVILSIARTHEKLTPLIDCTDYFIRKKGIYQILSNTFLFDALEDWKGIEDKIHSLRLIKLQKDLMDYQNYYYL